MLESGSIEEVKPWTFFPLKGFKKIILKHLANTVDKKP